MNITQLRREIDQIAKDKGIDPEQVIASVEEAMKQAAKQEYGVDKEIEARFNQGSGEVEIFEFRTVTEQVEDDAVQITLEDARRLDPDVEVGDEIGIPLDTRSFGRILAQRVKQVIVQHMRDAERGKVFDEFKDRKGEIVNGMVRRFEKGAILVDLGRAEAVLPSKEQTPRESYRPGDRIRAYVSEVNQEAKGSQIVLTRSSVDFLKKLFEQEVPEIYEGIVSIVSAAREPGGRSKIAVASRDGDVDPVGACVGIKGSRVQAVVQELRGERIDIVPHNDDPARYVTSALSPAELSRAIIDESARQMDVIVPDDQLSLAIGRKGQNVRLAVELTGWDINIRSESEVQKLLEWYTRAASAIPGWGEAEAEMLIQGGVWKLEELAECTSELLEQIGEADEAACDALRKSARELLQVKAEEERRAAEEAEAARRAAQAGAADAKAQAEEADPADGDDAAEAATDTAPPAPVAASDTASPDAAASEATPEAASPEAAASDAAAPEATPDAASPDTAAPGEQAGAGASAGEAAK